MTALSLIVIRSQDADASTTFYERIGLEFEREQHGTGPEHFAATIGSTVFEIYPGTDNTRSHVRLGFRVESVDRTLADLVDSGATLVSEAKDSPWGRRAVVEDPDGNRVELNEQTD